MNSVNEKSTAYVEATFKDKDGVNAAPTAARYRIDCVTTGTAVKGWTAISSPGEVEEITIKPDDVAIITDGNAEEIKRVTVEATYGTDDSVYEQYDLTVKNLSGVDADT